MGQADPLNFVDGISDSTGVLIFEFENDSFFPNANASRPLTGSSYLIDCMGLERARRRLVVTVPRFGQLSESIPMTAQLISNLLITVSSVQRMI